MPNQNDNATPVSTTYLDHTLPASERVAALLDQMTIEEKAGQLVGILLNDIKGALGGIDETKAAQTFRNGIGQIAAVGISGGSPENIARINNQIQRELKENTRLGIPAILHNEVLNGVQAEGFTSFPTAIGLAAGWNPALVGEIADLIRKQMLATGIRQGLAPVLDVSRDARWGRTHETFGEDTLLASAYAVAYVSGLQTETLKDGVIATAKHFVGYSATEGGQNMSASHIGRRELRDVHAAPFEAAIRLAGLGGIMNSYSEIDGIPVSIDRSILTDLLRGELGFDGVVVTDYRSLFYTAKRHKIAGDATEIAQMALHAGIDVELPSAWAFGNALVTGVESGTIPQIDLDLAVSRVLIQKFELGLFENPFVDENSEEIRAIATAGKRLSFEAAAQSVTLLENKKGALPLPKGLGQIAVIGPHGDSVMAGFANYTYPPVLEMLKGIATGDSRMAGMEGVFEAASPESKKKMMQRLEALSKLDPEQSVRNSYGAKSLAESIGSIVGEEHVVLARGCGVRERNEDELAEALSAAKDSEVVVLALGGRSAAFAGSATEGEGSDSATLELPAAQLELARAIARLGKRVITVVYMGKPYILDELASLSSALLTAYYPGPEGGQALAASLFGEVNPSGKLPFTVPRHVGQVPLYYSQKWGSGQRRTKEDMFNGYVDLPADPAYAFGHGLSYTEFEYSGFQAEQNSVDLSEPLEITVTVSNVGDQDGTEVVQLYVEQERLNVTGNALQLAGFARVPLTAGARSRVKFQIDPQQFGYTGADNRFAVTPGHLKLSVGAASDDLRETLSIQLTGNPKEVLAPHAHLPAVSIIALDS